MPVSYTSVVNINAITLTTHDLSVVCTCVCVCVCVCVHVTYNITPLTFLPFECV